MTGWARETGKRREEKHHENKDIRGKGIRENGESLKLKSTFTTKEVGRDRI